MKRTWQCIGLTLLLLNPRILLAKVNYRQRYNFRRFPLETQRMVDFVTLHEELHHDKHRINRQEIRRRTNQSGRRTSGTPSIPTNSFDSSNILRDKRPIQKSYSNRISMKMNITPAPSISPYPTSSHVGKKKSKSKLGKGGMKNKKPTCPPILPESPQAPAPSLRPPNTPITSPIQPPMIPVVAPVVSTTTPLPAPVPSPAVIPSSSIPVLSTTPINSWSFSPSIQPVTATPLTASPVQPPMSPVAAPVVSTTNPLSAPIPSPVVLPSSNIPTAPTPTSGTPVMASPFAVNYAPPSSTANSNDFQAASDLTCAHIKQYLVQNFDLSPFIILEDVICSSNGTTTTPTTISYVVTPIFGGDLSLTPSQSSIDELIRVALLAPAVTSLISALNGLPTNNPFSLTTGVVYDSSAPLLAVQSIDTGAVWKTTDLFGASNEAINMIAPSPDSTRETLFPTLSNSIESSISGSMDSSYSRSYSGSNESSYSSFNDLKSNEKGKGMRQKQSKSPQPISCSPATIPTLVTLHPSSKYKTKKMKMGKGMNKSSVPTVVPRPISCPPTKISTTVPVASGVPVTISPVLLAPVPVSMPTSTITAAPMNIPMALPVTLSPVILAPVPVSVPIPGISVRATPFSVVYTPTSAPVTAIDFMSAIDLTCIHVKESLRAIIGLNPFNSLVDITCTSVSTSTAPAASISYDVVIIFSPTSSMVLTTNNTDDILEIAFLPPEVTNLINDLRTLPASNPFSTVTSTVYSIAPAPIRAPISNLTTTDSSNNNMVQINGSYLFTVSGIVGILLLFFTAIFKQCRSVHGTNNKNTISIRPENNESPFYARFNKLSMPGSSTIRVLSPSLSTTKREILIDSNRKSCENQKANDIIDFLASRHDEYIATSIMSIGSTINDIDPLLQLSSSSSPVNRRKKLVL
jgi:hypothetical protein